MNIRQGKCDYCRTCFRWNANFMRLRDAYCPQCGEKLQATTHLKRWTWKEIPPISIWKAFNKFPEMFPCDDRKEEQGEDSSADSELLRRKIKEANNMRKCKVCNELKNDKDFYLKNKSTCKKCITKRAAVWQEAHPGKAKEYGKKTRDNPGQRKKQAEYHKEWYKNKGIKRSKRRLESAKTWRKLNPEACHATELVRYAVRTGKIKKPQICTICKEKRKLAAHHENYEFPLRVKWVCYSCHQRIHNGVYSIYI